MIYLPNVPDFEKEQRNMKYMLLLLPAFLFAFVPVDNEGNHRIIGVIQAVYNYDVNTKENNFSL